MSFGFLLCEIHKGRQSKNAVAAYHRTKKTRYLKILLIRFIHLPADDQLADSNTLIILIIIKVFYCWI